MTVLRSGRRARRFLPLVVLLIVTALYAGLLGTRVLWPIRYESIIQEESARADLDADLVCVVIFAESRYRVDAVSPRGAMGLMQLMPATASWIAEQTGLPQPTPEDLMSAALNVRLGTWYLRYLIDRFGDVELALMAYNAGPTNVDRWLASGESPFQETAAYLDRIESTRWIYRLYLRQPWLRKLTPSLVF